MPAAGWSGGVSAARIPAEGRLSEKEEIESQGEEADPDADDMGHAEGTGTRGLRRIIRMGSEKRPVANEQPSAEDQPDEQEKRERCLDEEDHAGIVRRSLRCDTEKFSGGTLDRSGARTR